MGYKITKYFLNYNGMTPQTVDDVFQALVIFFNCTTLN